MHVPVRSDDGRSTAVVGGPAPLLDTLRLLHSYNIIYQLSEFKIGRKMFADSNFCPSVSRLYVKSMCIGLAHGKLSDNSSSRWSTKQTTYKCTGSESIYKIVRIVEVPYTVYEFTRIVQQLTRLLCQNVEVHNLQISVQLACSFCSMWIWFKVLVFLKFGLVKFKVLVLVY